MARNSIWFRILSLTATDLPWKESLAGPGDRDMSAFHCRSSIRCDRNLTTEEINVSRAEDGRNRAQERLKGNDPNVD